MSAFLIVQLAELITTYTFHNEKHVWIYLITIEYFCLLVDCVPTTQTYYYIRQEHFLSKWCHNWDIIRLIIQIPHPLCCKWVQDILLVNCLHMKVCSYTLCMYIELLLLMFELYKLKLRIRMYYLVSYVSVYVPCIFTIGQTQGI